MHPLIFALLVETVIVSTVAIGALLSLARSGHRRR
jgi:hypothetical protein